MAKKSGVTSNVTIIELSINLNSRGRRVVHGTLVVDGEVRTVKHELSDSEKFDVRELILRNLHISPADTP